MDNNIRQLLAAAAQQSVAGKGSFLDQAFTQLKTASSSKANVDGSLPYGSDLYVICAEIALKRNEASMARDCLKMFFMKTPPPNQFLCRAYLCHAQLLAPRTADDKEQLEKAVSFILKAITFAKGNVRYHFLVYNASVLYWQFCRPFLKPTYRKYLSVSLHSVVKALDDIDDKDVEWRAMLMIALIECHIDANHIKEAGEVSKVTADFSKTNVPKLFKQVLALQVRHSLVDLTKLAKDLRQSSDLTAFYRIMKLRVALEQREVTDINGTMGKLIGQVLKEDDLSRPSSVISSLGRKTPAAEESKGKQSMTPTPSIASGVGQEELGSRKSSIMSITQLASAANDVKTAASKWRQSGVAIGPIKLDEIPELLLELAHLCSEFNQPELLKMCLDGLKTLPIKDKTIYLSMEFLECELMVRNLGFAQEMYTKNSVEVRLQAAERLSEAIVNAVRSGDPDIIQVGCVTMWNICLPLMQNNIRKTVRKQLTLIADALEGIDSLLILLRCQLHTELAKIEEDEEQIEVAMEHLKKAIGFDDGGQYSERLQTSLHRLELRAELYKTPERMEDKAAMIIEQARKSSESGTVRMKRSLLVQAGQALSPEAFHLVLESESETKGVTGGRGAQTLYSPLGSKAEHFKKCVKKAAGHIKRLGAENDRERARLWADLAKTARKQEVWDVCRVAARFCLLYDDNRWHMPAPPTRAETRQESVLSEQPPSSEVAGSKRGKSASQQGSAEVTVLHSDKDLIRILAEINFLNSEALVHLLRSQNVDLKNEPIPPVDTSKKPKGYVAKKPEQDEDWIKYRDWITNLSESALKGFLRAAELGVQLKESWIVCSATAYIWNYCSHILEANRHREMIPYFTTLLNHLKVVGHAGESALLVNLCNALGIGLMTQWIPTPQDLEDPSPSPRGKGSKEEGSVRKAKSVTSHTSTKSKTMLTDPEATEELKQALEVCELGLNASSGNRHVIVPIAVKHSLLITWVKVKQLLSQQVTKTLGSDDEGNVDGQTFITRCLVALEMLTLNGNGLMSFKEAPILEELCNMVNDCKWPDALVELQVWTRMSQLALKSRNHPLVMRCSEKALTFDLPDRIRRTDSHKQMVWYEMLSHAACLLGQSHILVMQGKNAIRRLALEAFVKATKYGKKAGNSELVITAARRYWNGCLALVTEPMERQLLKKPLSTILDCINATSKKTRMEKSEKKDNSSSTRSSASATSLSRSSAGGGEDGTPTGDILTNPEDDLTLRAALYGVLFQSYKDQGEWEEALAAMDKAIADMPRTKHRLLIFKHRLMVKAKLGRDIHVDIAKFKDESEDYVAMMWHKIAKLSRDKQEQLAAFQQAIENLKSPRSDWQKCDYILEFAEWLYINEYPILDCIDQLDWVIDILLNMKVHTVQRATEGSAKKGKKGRKSALQRENKESSQRLHTPIQEKEEQVEQEDGVKAEDYIPVEKKASILGLAATNLSMNITELRSIKLLEHLVRAHVMVALFADRGSPRHLQACLMAWGLLNRIWQVSLPSAAYVAKQQAKAAVAQDQASNKSSAKGKKGAPKDPKGGKAQDLPREKPKRKGPIDALPMSFEEWASYEVPEEIREAFKEDNSGEGINKDTIMKPSLTMYFLFKLIAEMRAIGYNHLVFPALNMAEVVARDICASDTVGSTCRLISMEVCTELNLMEASKLHESSAGSLGLSDKEQASSREEIALMKEKQAQVEREAKRAEELQRQMLLNSQGSSKPSKPLLRNIAPPDQKMDIEESVEGLGEHLSAVSFRQAWTQQAEVLTRQGYYQAARELLSEAFLSAEAFRDDYSRVHILIQLAELSCKEGEYKQCINFLNQAQSLPGHEDLWMKITSLMVEATLSDLEDKDRNNKAKALILKALNVFESLTMIRPNKETNIGYMRAELQASFASIQVKQVLQEGGDTLQPRIHKELLSACQRFCESSTAFIKCGYKRRAVEVMEQHANVLRLFACDSQDKESQHAFLLQSYSILREAVETLDTELSHISTLTHPTETSLLSFPIQRELSAIKNSFGELLIDMFTIFAEEDRQRKMKDARKSSVEKLVEEYTAITPDLTDTEKQWQLIAGLTAQTAVTHLATAERLSGKFSPLRAKSLLNIGRCFRILGVHYSPSAAHQWDVHYMNLEVTGSENVDQQQEEEENRDVEGEEEEKDEAKRTAERMESITQKYKLDQQTSERYFAQAAEVLSQCVQLSLQEDLKDITAAASLDMVECCGQFDQVLGSQYLALYQSCQASKSMSEMLSRAQLDPSTSQQATLFHQKELMRKRDIESNWSYSTLSKAIVDNLNDTSEAWKRLKISPQHMEIVKEFPSNFNVIILQHTEDRSVLYGAFMERPKPAGTKEGGKGKGAPGTPSRARLVKVNVDPMAIKHLTQSMKQHKHEVMQTLLKLQFRKSQQAQRLEMLENLTDDMKESLKDFTGDFEKAEEHLQESFLGILKELEEYLRPVTSYFQPVISQLDAACAPVGKDSSASGPEEFIILLADRWLLEMPLEALALVSSPNFTSISRDFSLQMSHHRIHKEPEAAPTDDGDDKKKKAAAKDKAAKEKEKNKNVKMIPIDRTPPAYCLPVDTNTFKYIIDPYCDVVKTDDNSPIKVTQDALTVYQNQFTARWEGIMGDDHVPSLGEWEQQITDCGSFIFYGLEKFFSHVPPFKLAPMNLADCNLAMLLDMAQTSDSFMRQSKIDVEKSSNDLSLEKPVDTAMLLSLTGVSCILANQWHCSLTDNARNIQTILKAILETGRTSGQTVRRMFIPHWRPQGEEPLGEEEEGEEDKVGTPQPGQGKEKDGAGKPADKKVKSADSKSSKASRGGGQKGKPPTSGKKKQSRDEAELAVVQQESKEDGGAKEEDVFLKRNWYNVVCYGLPNLMVANV
ncbi:cilia- and flagella-associated protein 46-like isoform X3 [Apostichopus japonicus]|uniref:cilia- and flagella-associated protein 46-like isoform X3 n=1 Tax=Stichopus japonicus TaxID=307972 RepID=UPI003AB5FB7F